MQHGDDVYLPFSFIQKYFDVSVILNLQILPPQYFAKIPSN